MTAGSKSIVYGAFALMCGMSQEVAGLNSIGDISPWEDNQLNANSIYVTKFTASSSFTATTMGLFWAGAPTGTMSMAIYVDLDGTPGALLDSTATLTAQAPRDSAGYQQVPLSTPLPMVSGTSYWLGFNQSSALNYVGFDQGGSGYSLDTACCGWITAWSGGTQWDGTLTIFAADSMLGTGTPPDTTTDTTGNDTSGIEYRYTSHRGTLGLQSIVLRNTPTILSVNLGLSLSALCGEIRLEMFDMNGRRVWNSLVNRQVRAGTSVLAFDHAQPAGTYLVRIHATDRQGISIGNFTASVMITR